MIQYSLYMGHVFSQYPIKNTNMEEKHRNEGQ